MAQEKTYVIDGRNVPESVFDTSQKYVLDSMIARGQSIDYASPMLSGQAMWEIGNALELGTIDQTIAGNLSRHLIKMRREQGKENFSLALEDDDLAYRAEAYIHMISAIRNNGANIRDLSICFDPRATEEMLSSISGVAAFTGHDVMYEYCMANGDNNQLVAGEVYSKLMNDPLATDKIRAASNVSISYGAGPEAQQLMRNIHNTHDPRRLWLLEECMSKNMSLAEVNAIIPGGEWNSSKSVRDSYLEYAKHTGIQIGEVVLHAPYQAIEQLNENTLVELVQFEESERRKLTYSRNYDPDKLIPNETKLYIHDIAARESAGYIPEGSTRTAIECVTNYHLGLDDMKKTVDAYAEYARGALSLEKYSKIFEDILDKSEIGKPMRAQLGKLPFGNYVLSDGTKIPKRKFDRDTRNAIANALEDGYDQLIENALKRNLSPEAIRGIVVAAREGIDVEPISARELDSDAVLAYIEASRAGIDVKDKLMSHVWEPKRENRYKMGLVPNKEYLSGDQIRQYVALLTSGADKELVEEVFKGNPTYSQTQKATELIREGYNPELITLIANGHINDMLATRLYGIATGTDVSEELARLDIESQRTHYLDRPNMTRDVSNARNIVSEPEMYGLSDTQTAAIIYAVPEAYTEVPDRLLVTSPEIKEACEYAQKQLGQGMEIQSQGDIGTGFEER